jgi:signal transduction histidine kinase
MRVTISVRLSMIFGLVTALVLAALGLLLYTQTRLDLTAAIDQGLQSRASVIAGAIGRLGHVVPDTGGPVQPDDAFVQVISDSGRIVDTSANTHGLWLLPRQQLRPMAGDAFFTRRLRGFDDAIRIFATRYSSGRHGGVVVVGATLGDTADSLAHLAHSYLLDALIALAGVVAAGWLVVRAALRPVERMRAQASTISLTDTSGLLPVPRADDELGRLARTLNSMLGRLRGAYERERRFIDYASHELRTPLTALRAELDLALTRPRPAPELAAAITSAGEEVDRLILLSENLLTLAAAGPGNIPLHRVSQPLAALAQAAAEAMAEPARQHGIGLRVCADESTAPLDSLLVRQALTNLLHNAARYAPPRTTITMCAHHRAGRAVLTVADQGPGFPDGFAEHAFEPFSRARPGDAGAGLGLAIVAAIAQAHGGTAVAGNQPGGGAYVTIDLDARVATASGRLSVR